MLCCGWPDSRPGHQAARPNSGRCMRKVRVTSKAVSYGGIVSCKLVTILGSQCLQQHIAKVPVSGVQHSTRSWHDSYMWSVRVVREGNCCHIPCYSGYPVIPVQPQQLVDYWRILVPVHCVNHSAAPAGYMRWQTASVCIAGCQPNLQPNLYISVVITCLTLQCSQLIDAGSHWRKLVLLAWTLALFVASVQAPMKAWVPCDVLKCRCMHSVALLWQSIM